MRSTHLCTAGFFMLAYVAVAGAQVCPSIASTINLIGPVTGAPFAADYVHVFQANNRDGSRNHQESHGKLYRDSEGRARCDIENLNTGKTRFVIITDPVANVSIRMNLEQQTARVTHYPKSSSPFAPANPSQNSESKDHVVVPAGGAHAEKDLGSKEIEGLKASGIRYSNSTETGETSTLEEWSSPELKFMLLSTGESPYGLLNDQLKNIHTGDPDPSVFQVPDGFSVKDLYCRGNACGFDSP